MASGPSESSPLCSSTIHDLLPTASSSTVGRPALMWSSPATATSHFFSVPILDEALAWLPLDEENSVTDNPNPLLVQSGRQWAILPLTRRTGFPCVRVRDQRLASEEAGGWRKKKGITCRTCNITTGWLVAFRALLGPRLSGLHTNEHTELRRVHQLNHASESSSSSSSSSPEPSRNYTKILKS